MCLVSLHLTLKPAMIDTQRHDDEAEDTEELDAAPSGQCLPGRAATLTPKSNLPGYRRRRRNSLVFLKKCHVCLASLGSAVSCQL